jgi:hypothetical protein
MISSPKVKIVNRQDPCRFRGSRKGPTNGTTPEHRRSQHKHDSQAKSKESYTGMLHSNSALIQAPIAAPAPFHPNSQYIPSSLPFPTPWTLTLNHIPIRSIAMYWPLTRFRIFITILNSTNLHRPMHLNAITDSFSWIAKGTLYTCRVPLSHDIRLQLNAVSLWPWSRVWVFLDPSFEIVVVLYITGVVVMPSRGRLCWLRVRAPGGQWVEAAEKRS